MTRLDLKLNGHLENCVCKKCGEAREAINQISKMGKRKYTYKGKVKA